MVQIFSSMLLKKQNKFIISIKLLNSFFVLTLCSSSLNVIFPTSNLICIQTYSHLTLALIMLESVKPKLI